MIEKPSNAALFKVPSVGTRTYSGQLLLSIEQAENAEKKGILLVRSLAPSQVSILSNLGGLVLLTEGPCSHIVLLAKSFGIAVLCQARTFVELQANNEFCIVAGSSVTSGSVVTVSEETGSLYIGAIGQNVMDTKPPTRMDFSNTPYYWSLSTPESLIEVNRSFEASKIGLCRSELQLFANPCQQDFQEYLRATILREEPAIPISVKSRLRDALEEMLSFSGLTYFNYRILDAATVEYVDHLIVHADNLPNVRGPKWCIESGFYEWQIDMAIAAYQNSNLLNCNFFITVPSISILSEVRHIRKIFDLKLLKYTSCKAPPKFGVMIENAGTANDIVSYVPFADLICFGINDLTQSVTGIERSSWPSVSHFYIAHGLCDSDIYLDLKCNPTLSILNDSLGKLFSSAPNIAVLICGSASPSFSLENYFEKKIGLTIEPNLVHTLPGKSNQQREKSVECNSHALALARVVSARTIGDRELAKDLALEWSRTFNRSGTNNWKVFKKFLVLSRFADLPGQFLEPNWDKSTIISEIAKILEQGAVPRCSEFTNSASCHSRSIVIPDTFSDKEIGLTLDEFSKTSYINVFPQQSEHNMCFRLYQTKDEFMIEAGVGQAMYIFEEDRENNTTIKLFGDIAFKNITYFGDDEEILSMLKDFVDNSLDQILRESRATMQWLGIDSVGLEGYYVSDTSTYLIVDIDLPLDLAWN